MFHLVFYVGEAYGEYISGALQNNLSELEVHYYNDLDKMFAEIREKKPQFIITALFNMKGIGGPEHTQRIIKKLRSESNATIIGCDGIFKPEQYLRAGFDYFFPLTATMSRKFALILYKIIENKKIHEDEKALVFEKKDFYDYVARERFFDKRASKTTSTQEELKFLLKRIDGKILDAGCGNGRLAIPLAQLGYEIIGVDISSVQIEKANKKKGNSKYSLFIRADLLHSPFKNEEFDTVIMMWHTICEFRKFRFDLLKEMSRIIRVGGQLIFDIPNTSKLIKINESGIYKNQVDAFTKYVGLVPDLAEMISFLNASGFTHIYYYSVYWGAPKIVIIAKKEKLF